MIRINLLPEEFRRTERTSPKLFATVLLAVILVCCSFGWFGYVYFGELGKLQLEHAQISERLSGLEKRVVYHDALQAERTDYQKRKETIEQISRSRVIWTKILDQFIDVVNNEGDIQRHRAWFGRLQVRDGDGKNGPVMTLPAWVEGEEPRAVADFHEDVESAPFFEYVAEKSFPDARLAEDDTRKPAESLGFQLELKFRRPSKWHEARGNQKGK